ncbi:DUF4123 domain-containing protein [Burkholderia sp. Ac-20365]|uniref:DUF4123 domain-containing protein n=1 Tax=Burkholderia sp. Ac-20365 TaxID=2703897 RepID=UPI00197B0F20|nr:DUF4123 domain-containing protein [Burkholderia sp. Ac-20365]MBN3766228.1 DUF4123 domain-containing protein [Burkholderia sp. Ac-20365]
MSSNASVIESMAPEALEQEIVGFLAPAADRSLYALVYGVAYPTLFSVLSGKALNFPATPDIELVFDAPDDIGARQFGPFVIPIDPSRRDVIRLLCENWVNDPRGLSLIVSPLSLQRLTDAIRIRLDATCDDGTEWQVKLFDTRAIPVLAKALPEHQLKSYLAMLDEWWYLDRKRSLQKVIRGFQADAPYLAPLKLNDRQISVFTDAGVVDSILYMLAQTDDDLLAMIDEPTRYDIVADALNGATDQERNSSLLLADRARRALIAFCEDKLE